MADKKSLSLEEKLNNRFAPSPIMADFDTLLNTAADSRAFQSQEELANYLSEGALLHINTLGTKALSIPCGEYMVWTTDTGNTMLVPTNEAAHVPDEVFEARADQYEVLTPQLLNNYSCCGKAILENENSSENPNFENNQPETGGEEDEEEEHGGFKSKIHMSTVNRTPIARAMEQRGYTVTSLADACGVDPPAISRILRTPKDTVGDPGGRNPSIGLAAKISQALKMDAEALFPDIFNVPKQSGNLAARDTPGNRGSGMSGAAAGSTRKGKATQKWTQGNKGQSQNESFNPANIANLITEDPNVPSKYDGLDLEDQFGGGQGQFINIDQERDSATYRSLSGEIYHIGPGSSPFEHYEFYADNYDGAPDAYDTRIGHCNSINDCAAKIDEIENEFDY